jgi:hypothetical protein
VVLQRVAEAQVSLAQMLLVVTKEEAAELLLEKFGRMRCGPLVRREMVCDRSWAFLRVVEGAVRAQMGVWAACRCNDMDRSHPRHHRRAALSMLAARTEAVGALEVRKTVEVVELKVSTGAAEDAML